MRAIAIGVLVGWLALGWGSSAVLTQEAKAPAAATAKAGTEQASKSTPDGASSGPAMTMEQFLDRLMMAESGGRLDARNPRSTAVGPFQFIESTFLAVSRQHFAAEVEGKAAQEILALRTDMKFSRRAAEAYTRDNAIMLKSHDVEPSYPNLRLAFLLGAGGAIRVLKAHPDTPLAQVLPPAVLIANPFMSMLTARGLVQRSAREVNQPVTTSEGVNVPPGAVVPRRAVPPGIAVRCNLRLPSCKRWLALSHAKARAPKSGATAPVKLAAAGAAGVPLHLGPARQARGKAALARRAGRVSPTMEAAARGVPLSGPVARNKLAQAKPRRR